MNNEWRVFGPPGTGKTTWLSRQISNAIEHGNEVMVSSFSKSAAEELIGRGMASTQENTGTLHAFCYRAIGLPTIAETKLKEWNEAVSQEFRIGQTADAIEICGSESTGDGGAGMLGAYGLIRGMCVTVDDPKAKPYIENYPGIRRFIAEWENWKKQNEYLDFTDLLTVANDSVDKAPGNPNVGFFDEVQDFNPLMMKIIRKWGCHMDKFILCGDEDQTIYSFMGASPESFLSGELEEGRKIVLGQSYRVPAAVKRVTDNMIKKVKIREEKEYHARDFEGEVVYADKIGSRFVTYKSPESLLEQASGYIEKGKTCMFLASCTYMLEQVVKDLRANGTPFHNPYRRINGSWNPIKDIKGKTTPTWYKLMMFLRPFREIYGESSRAWTVAEARIFLTMLKKKADGLLKEFPLLDFPTTSPSATCRPNDLFTPESDIGFYTSAIGLDLKESLLWLESNALAAARKSLEYPIQCVNSGNALTISQPKVIVGTIHSVKGGEADVVFLFPDLSPGAARMYETQDGRDSATRLFYVGATRARETLVICSPVKQRESFRME